MSWNLIERIINAVKPKESQQVSDTSEPWPENQPQPEFDDELFESSDEPSPSHQKKLRAIQQGEYHD